MLQRVPRALLRLAGFAACVAALAGATCNFPTDKSDELFVTVTSPDTLFLKDSVLRRGDVLDLEARVWRRTGPADSVDVPNVDFKWLSGDRTVATVEPTSSTTGAVTGVKSGRAYVEVDVTGFEKASSAFLPIRVAEALEIDSVKPDTVKYGQLLTFYGVGVRSIFLAQLGTGELIPDTFSFQGVRDGLGQLSFWVPPPSHSAPVLVFGPGIFFATGDTTHVKRFDIYEPNKLAPRKLSLDGPGPFPQVPAVLFFNPALSFEELARTDSFGVDWYRFTKSDTTQPVTLVLSSPKTAGTFSTFLTDSLYLSSGRYLIGDSSWTIGPGTYFCKGKSFRPLEKTADSTVVAFKQLPSRVLHLISIYRKAGAYGLTVVQGFVPSDKRIQPDRFEENNICNFADENFKDPTKQIIVSATRSFADTLTIDSPHDIDWFRFQVQGAIAQPVTIQTAPRPFSTTVPDSSDIDLYVLKVPTASNGLDRVGLDTTTGSTSKLTMLLAPADYYLAVVDFAGVPTRYALCIVDGVACTPPAAPAVVPVAPGRSKSARMARPSAAVRSASDFTLPLRDR